MRQQAPAPQNIEAEASLLGAVLIDSDAIVEIADVVSATDFFDPLVLKHRLPPGAHINARLLRKCVCGADQKNRSQIQHPRS